MDLSKEELFVLGWEEGRQQLMNHIESQCENGKPVEINGKLYWLKDANRNLQDVMDDIEASWKEEQKEGNSKMTKQNIEQEFLENAVEAATKIREIYHIFGGYGNESSPEDGLLGDVYECVADMISSYIAPVTGKELNSDELNNITCKIMHMDKEGIGDFIRKYFSN